MAVLMSGFMVTCYIIPNSGATLVWQEWLMVGGWIVLGGVFFVFCRSKYKEKFGSLVEIISDADAAALQIPDKELDEMLDHAISAAIEAAIATVLNEEAAKQL